MGRGGWVVCAKPGNRDTVSRACARSGNEKKKMSQVILLAGTYYLGHVFGCSYFIFLLLFNRAKAGVGISVYMYLGGVGGFLGGFLSSRKKILRPICINTALNKLNPYHLCSCGSEEKKKKRGISHEIIIRRSDNQF